MKIDIPKRQHELREMSKLVLRAFVNKVNFRREEDPKWNKCKAFPYHNKQHIPKINKKVFIAMVSS